MNVDQITEILEFNLMVGFSIDKIQVDLNINKITGMIIGEDTLEVM